MMFFRYDFNNPRDLPSEFVWLIDAGFLALKARYEQEVEYLTFLKAVYTSRKKESDDNS